MRDALHKYGHAVSARLNAALNTITDPAIRDAVKASLGPALAYSAVMGATVSPQSEAMRFACLVVASEMERLGLLPDATDTETVSAVVPGPEGAQ